MVLIDSHCHPQLGKLSGRENLTLANMRAAGVAAAVAVCTRLDELPGLARLADKHEEFFHTVGVHPCSINDGAGPSGGASGENNGAEQGNRTCTAQQLTELVRSLPTTVAIGETGLDYSRGEPSARTIQEPLFQAHIEAALETGLPLVVHTRESMDDALDILKPAAQRGLNAVLHCFSGTWQQATAAWDAGLLVSFTGIVTFKKAAELLSVAVRAPLDGFMLETDAPYLAPEPHRGKLNEPANVLHIARKIAHARNTSLEDLAAATTAACVRFYNLPAQMSAAHSKANQRQPDCCTS